MRCAWDSFVNLLPTWMRSDVDRRGRETLQELRLRVGHPPELVLKDGTCWLDRKVTHADITFCVNAASRYSPWSAATGAWGYITAPGGHRLGICGEAVVTNGNMTGISCAQYLCLRVARDFPGIAASMSQLEGSMLIIGPPGCGKTTFLRDLVRCLSDRGPGSVAVVDERRELFPGTDACFPAGKRTDVMSGCAKPHGIEALLRAMGPSIIAVDEITSRLDCKALLEAGWCGVRLLVTAHAWGRSDLYCRPVYKPLVDSGLFEHLVTMRRDKTWVHERMSACTVKC